MSSTEPLTAADPARVEKMLRDHAAMGSEALCIMSSESASILRLLDAARAALRGTREAVAEDDRKHLALAREIGKILDPQQALNTAALAASRYQRRLDAAEARVRRLEEAGDLAERQLSNVYRFHKYEGVIMAAEKLRAALAADQKKEG